MARLNVISRPVGLSPITTEAYPTARTYNGGAGYKLDTLSELYLTGVSTLAGEDNFYESASARNQRFVGLIHQATATDPEWVRSFLNWLRRDANLRTIAIVGAAEHAKACIDLGIPGARQAVKSVLVRADEPGELIAYWVGKYGRKIPKPVKRGVADAVKYLYNERNLLKWDSASRGYRFADVIALTHPSPRDERSSSLFSFIVADRRGKAEGIPTNLKMLAARSGLTSLPVEVRRSVAIQSPGFLAEAGMTWESLAGWVQGPMDKAMWESIIPEMGYMALLRNLRNFDQAGVSDKVAAQVASKLSDPAEVEKSRQLPMRFLSAYRAAPNLRWSYPLELALTHSLKNIPVLDGNTLILVDTSSSMNAGFSKDGTLRRWDAAAVFGIALAQRCQSANVVSYSSGGWGGRLSQEFPVMPGESLLRALDRFKSGGFFIGGGTDTAGAVRANIRSHHTRVILLTDEQSSYGNPADYVSPTVPFYTFNLAGYGTSNTVSGVPNRHIFGGLTDASFRMIPLLESGRAGSWPWERSSGN